MDHGDEVVGHLFAVDDETAFEKPVPAMFAIGLGNVKAFDVCGIAADLVEKEVRVIIEVPFVECQAHGAIDFFEGAAASFYEGNLGYGFWFCIGVKGGEGVGVWAFGHAVVYEGQKDILLFHAQGRLDQITPRPFDARNLCDPAGMAYCRGIC